MSFHLEHLATINYILTLGPALSWVLPDLKNILYYDLASHQIKMALHIVFDKAMADSDSKTPIACLLCSDSTLSMEAVDLNSNLARIDIFLSLFTTLTTLDMPFDDHDCLPVGIEVNTCLHLH